MDQIEHNLEDELGIADHIILRRINDILLLILKNMNEKDADLLAEMHQNGIFLSPPPAWMPGADGD